MSCLKSREDVEQQMECCVWPDKLGSGGRNEREHCRAEAASLSPPIFLFIFVAQHHEGDT